MYNRLDDDLINKAVFIRNNEIISNKDIAKRLNVSRAMLQLAFKKLGLKGRNGSFYNKAAINNNYFNKINSVDRAYFLGFLYADGNLRKNRPTIQFGLWDKDKYILEIFKEYLETNYKLYKDKNSFRLIITDDTMYNDLIKLGCMPKKSKILKFPTYDQVPKKYMSHFIRGYFDGDGSVSIKKGRSKSHVSFCGQEDFLNAIIDEMNTIISIKKNKFYPRYKDQIDSSGSLYIHSQKDNVSFYNYIYKDCGNCFLTRKFEKFKI